MRSLNVFRIVVAALVAVNVAGTSVALGDEDPASDPGVQDALAAGIELSPEAEQIIADAPSGGCLSDPAADGCPAVTQIVAVDGTEDANGWTDYGPTDPTSRTVARRTHNAPVRGAALVDQCAVHADEPDVKSYGGNDKASGKSYNTCTSAATEQEIYSDLERWQSDTWLQLAAAMSKKNGGGTISATAIYDCHHADVYAYRTKAFGYSVVGGIGYTETQYAYQNHHCPT